MDLKNESERNKTFARVALTIVFFPLVGFHISDLCQKRQE